MSARSVGGMICPAAAGDPRPWRLHHFEVMSVQRRTLPGMKTRHVLMRPALDVGDPVPGLVLDWRKRPARGASPAMFEAYVASVHGDSVRVEWIPSMYLTPVHSAPPGSV